MSDNIKRINKHTEKHKKTINENLHNQINEYKIERIFGNQPLESCVRKVISGHLSV